MERARPRNIPQQVHRILERRAVEHRAGEQHPRHPDVQADQSQVVDRLHQPAAVHAERMSGQRSRIAERNQARSAFRHRLDHGATPAQPRIAVLVVADPPGAIGPAQRHRGATVVGRAQQVTTAMPQKHIVERLPEPLRQALEFSPDRRQRLPRTPRQRIHVRMPTPHLQRPPSRALRPVLRQHRPGMLAKGTADFAAGTGDLHRRGEHALELHAPPALQQVCGTRSGETRELLATCMPARIQPNRSQTGPTSSAGQPVGPCLRLDLSDRHRNRRHPAHLDAVREPTDLPDPANTHRTSFSTASTSAPMPVAMSPRRASYM